MYPEEKTGISAMEHYIVFTGEICSFEKYERRTIADQLTTYLNCVRIHGQDIEVISSKSYEFKAKDGSK